MLLSGTQYKVWQLRGDAQHADSLLPSVPCILQVKKMLEIGLGCDMSYGPGASARMLREFLPDAEIWFAESDGEPLHDSVDGQQACGRPAVPR